MNIIIEIFISCILTLYVFIGAIRINLSKKDKNGLIVGLISMISIVFGIYLWIKNGLILDYGTEEELIQTHAQIMFLFGIVNILIGLLFSIISILKYIFWRINRTENNS